MLNEVPTLCKTRHGQKSRSSPPNASVEELHWYSFCLQKFQNWFAFPRWDCFGSLESCPHAHRTHCVHIWEVLGQIISDWVINLEPWEGHQQHVPNSALVGLVQSWPLWKRTKERQHYYVGMLATKAMWNYDSQELNIVFSMKRLSLATNLIIRNVLRKCVYTNYWCKVLSSEHNT